MRTRVVAAHPQAALTSCIAASECGALSVLCEGGAVRVLRPGAAPTSARCSGVTAQAWTRDGAIFAAAVGTAVELRRGSDVGALIARIVPSERKSKIADVAVAVVATETVDVVLATRVCAVCGQSKPKSGFSKKQWRNAKRCRECVVDISPAPATVYVPDAFGTKVLAASPAARALRRHILVAAASASGVRLYCVVVDALPPGPAWRGASAARALVHRSTTLRTCLVSSYSVCCVRFGGRRAGVLAAAARDGHVAVWSTAEQLPSTESKTLPALWRGVVTERITSITFSPDGCALAIGSWDGGVAVYRAAGTSGGGARMPTAADPATATAAAAAAWAHAGEESSLQRISLAAFPQSRTARLAALTPTPWIRGSEHLACGTFTAWRPDGGALAIADGKRRALWLHLFARGGGASTSASADDDTWRSECSRSGATAEGLPALRVFVCRVDPRGLVPGPPSVAGRRAWGFDLAGLLPQPPGWARELALVRVRWPVAAAAATRDAGAAIDGARAGVDAGAAGVYVDTDATVNDLARDAAAAAQHTIAVTDSVTASAALVAASAALPTLSRVPLSCVAPRSHNDVCIDVPQRARRRVLLSSNAHGTVALLLAAAPAPHALQEGKAHAGAGSAGGAAEVDDEPALVEITWRTGGASAEGTAEVERTTLPLVTVHDVLRAAIAPLSFCSTTLAVTLGPCCIIAACGPRIFTRARGWGLAPKRVQWEELVLSPLLAGALSVAEDSIVRCVALAIDGGAGGCVALLRWQSGAARAFVL